MQQVNYYSDKDILGLSGMFDWNLSTECLKGEIIDISAGKFEPYMLWCQLTEHNVLDG